MTDAQYKLAKDQERSKEIKADKKRIDDALSLDDEQTLIETHMYIHAKYGAYIPDWTDSLHCYIEKRQFQMGVSKAAAIHNLKIMKAKLDGYAAGFEKPSNKSYVPSNSVNVNVSNTNEVNISVTFESVKQQIENMTALTDKETEEILTKIAELEEIINGNDKKKTKWEKAKSMLIWLADKSFDVGMTLLPLLLKIQ